MAGEAKSDAFMLGTATIMLGPVDKLMDLNVEQSIGLVKNVMIKTTPGFTDLTQGVKAQLVYSVMTSNPTVIDGEMYEYTGRNLSYGAGLDGSTIEAVDTKTTVTTGLATPVGPALTAATLDVEDPDGLEADDYCFIQIGTADQVMIRKVVSTDVDSVTFDRGFPFAIPVGTSVRKVNVIAVGSTEDSPFLACKIVGTMANGDEVAVLLPKVRVTSGITLGFKTDNFDNMPLQLAVFDLIPTDPFFTMFQKVGPNAKPAKAMLLTGE